MQNEKCKRCGNVEFNEGKLSNYATVQPVDKFFSKGSNIKISFCSKCGEVSSMQVENPEKFSK